MWKSNDSHSDQMTFKTTVKKLTDLWALSSGPEHQLNKRKETPLAVQDSSACVVFLASFLAQKAICYSVAPRVDSRLQRQAVLQVEIKEHHRSLLCHGMCPPGTHMKSHGLTMGTRDLQSEKMSFCYSTATRIKCTSKD